MRFARLVGDYLNCMTPALVVIGLLIYGLWFHQSV
jgi:hypothetical protein